MKSQNNFCSIDDFIKSYYLRRDNAAAEAESVAGTNYFSCYAED